MLFRKYAFTLCALLVGLFGTTHAFQMEANYASIPASTAPDQWVSVSFQAAFPTVPVVVTLTDGTNPQPNQVRIRNVTTTGFEMILQEPAPTYGGNVPTDGITPGVKVPYLAAEVGNHTLDDGTRIEVGQFKLNNVQYNFNPGPTEAWLPHTFTGGAFARPPALAMAIQTNENNARTPQCIFMDEAIQRLDETGFQYALDLLEVNACVDATTNINSELMGYIAMDPNVADAFPDINGDKVLFETMTTANIIRGYDNGCYVFPFQNPYITEPLTVGSQTSYSGNNGGLLRQCSLSSKEIGLTIDEDQWLNSERGHIAETAGLIIFDRPFVYGAAPLQHRKGVSRIIRNGTSLATGPVQAGDVIRYELQATGNGTLYDVSHTDQLQWLPAYQPDAQTPTANSQVELTGDSVLEQVLEYAVNGTFSTFVYFLVL